MRIANHLGMILGLLLGLGSPVGTGWAQTAGVAITPYQILTLSGDALGTTRINNSGVVALYGQGTAFLLKNQELSPVSLPVDAGLVYALGLNDSGDIVGEYFDPGFFAHAFAIVRGRFQSLSVPGVRRLSPHDINQQRVIVGSAEAQGEALKAFVLKGDEYTFFRCPGVVGYTVALGINRNGDIAGTCGNFPDEVGFVYRDGTFTFINYPGATSTQLFDINASGDLVGRATLGPGYSVPFLYRNGVFHDLSFPGLTNPDVTTTVHSINDLGVTVGDVFTVHRLEGGGFDFGRFSFIRDTRGLE